MLSTVGVTGPHGIGSSIWRRMKSQRAIYNSLTGADNWGSVFAASKRTVPSKSTKVLCFLKIAKTAPLSSNTLSYLGQRVVSCTHSMGNQMGLFQPVVYGHIALPQCYIITFSKMMVLRRAKSKRCYMVGWCQHLALSQRSTF